MKRVGQVWILLLVLVSGAVSQELGPCRLQKEDGVKGRPVDWTGLHVVKDVKECEQICLVEAACAVAEFRTNNLLCYLYSNDTIRSSEKSSTLFTKVCPKHDDTSFSLVSSASTSGGPVDPSASVDAASSMLPGQPDDDNVTLNMTSGNDTSVDAASDMNVTADAADCSDNGTCTVAADNSTMSVDEGSDNVIDTMGDFVDTAANGTFDGNVTVSGNDTSDDGAGVDIQPSGTMLAGSDSGLMSSQSEYVSADVVVATSGPDMATPDIYPGMSLVTGPAGVVDITDVVPEPSSLAVGVASDAVSQPTDVSASAPKEDYSAMTILPEKTTQTPVSAAPDTSTPPVPTVPPAKSTQALSTAPSTTTTRSVSTASQAKSTTSVSTTQPPVKIGTTSQAKSTTSVSTTQPPVKIGTTPGKGTDVDVTTASPTIVPVTKKPYQYPYYPYPGPHVSPGTPVGPGQYPPYPYMPYPYPPPYGFPPYPPRYPYPPYPGYPPQYPYPQGPQVNPGQPQIPIYQLPKGTDAPVTLHEKHNRLCFNRNKFPDLKLPEEKPKFFLIPSGDGKFSVVAVPTKYNPVVCFPVSYRGKVPILHLPAGNAPSRYNPYSRQQQIPFAGQRVDAYQTRNGHYPGATVPVPIDIESFIKQYGGYFSETTSSLPGGLTPTPLPGKPDNVTVDVNHTAIASGNDTDIDGMLSANETNINGTFFGNDTDIGEEVNTTMSIPGLIINATDLLVNATIMDNETLTDFTGNGTNVTSTDGYFGIDNATDSNISSIIIDALNKTSTAVANETMEGNITYSNATDVLLNETHVIESNVTVHINDTEDATTSAPVTDSTTPKTHPVRGFGRPKPPWRASKRTTKVDPSTKPHQPGKDRKKPDRKRKPIRPRKPLRPRKPIRPSRDPKDMYRGKHPMRYVRRKWRRRNQKKARFPVGQRPGSALPRRYESRNLVNRDRRRGSYFF